MYNLTIKADQYVDYNNSVEVNDNSNIYLAKLKSIENIAKPKNTTLRLSQEGNEVFLNWDPVDKNINNEETSVNKYEVYRKQIGKDNDFHLLNIIENSLEHKDIRLKSSIYKYYVIAVNQYDKKSEPSNIVTRESTNIDYDYIDSNGTSYTTSYNKSTGIMKVKYTAYGPIIISGAKYNGELLNGEYRIVLQLKQKTVDGYSEYVETQQIYNFTFDAGYTKQNIDYTTEYEFEIIEADGTHPENPSHEEYIGDETLDIILENPL